METQCSIISPSSKKNSLKSPVHVGNGTSFSLSVLRLKNKKIEINNTIKIFNLEVNKGSVGHCLIILVLPALVDTLSCTVTNFNL